MVYVIRIKKNDKIEVRFVGDYDIKDIIYL